jgi:uncharacterized protein YndB with AHSA1/START domain
MRHLGFVVLIAGTALAVGACAEVVDSQASGFTVRQSRVVAAPARTLWAALIRPGAWWSSNHTFSHDAHNLSLEAKPGGGWFETLPSGGGVRHLVVVNIDPPTLLRLEGALGPLQGLGVTGHLTFSLKAQGEATLITETYDAGGHAPGGLDKLADPVDRVLSEQLERLKTFVETGAVP